MNRSLIYLPFLLVSLVGVGNGLQIAPEPASPATYEFETVGKNPDWIVSFSPTADHKLVSSRERQYQREAESDIRDKALAVTRDYIDDLIGPGAGAVLGLQTLAELKEHGVLGKEYCELLRTESPLSGASGDSSGPEYLTYHRHWQELDFNPEFQSWARAEYARCLTSSRIAQSGLIGGTVLAVLATVLGFLHLNHRTRGSYAGRLQKFTLAAVLVIVAIGVLLSQAIHWI